MQVPIHTGIEGDVMSREILPNLFIIGMPRSGTKLLRALLNNHTLIYIPAIETAFIPRLIKKFGLRELTQIEIHRVAKEIEGSIFFFYYLKNNEFDFNKLILRPGSTVYDILTAFYIELTSTSFADYKFIGDKSPRNIHCSKVLADAFPNAKFIHIVRDPRDYALSVRKAWGKNELRAVFRWVEGISNFQTSIVAANKQFIEVRYEDLLEQPESTLKRCTDFLGLKYELDMARLSVSIENLGDARNPVIKNDNAGKYLQEMTPANIRRIDDYAVELLHRYGYPCRSDRAHNKPVSILMGSVLRPLDALSLLRFNMKRRGFRGALEKMTRASK